MTRRLTTAWKALTSLLALVWRKATTGGADGWLDELVLLVALGLVTVSLWPMAVRWIGSGLPALLPAGLCLLWSAIPARSPFVAHPSVPEKPTRRT